MSPYYLIAFSGVDGTGKSTQSRLLTRVMEPVSRFSFPDYKHWTGQILRSHFYAEKFALKEGNNLTWHESSLTPKQVAHLNCIGFLDAMPQIEAALRRGHVILDRYWLDMLAYQGAQGVGFRWLQRLVEELPIPNETFLFLSESFRVAGGDNWEKDKEFQQQVREKFADLFAEVRGSFTLIEAGQFAHLPTKAGRILAYHEEIVASINDARGLRLKPLSYEEVADFVSRESDQQLALAFT